MRTATGMDPSGLRRLVYAVEHAKDFSADQRKQAAKEGASLPDGSFPIYNQKDANDAADDIGRTNHPKATVIAHIKQRVKQLGLKAPPSVANFADN